MAQRQVGGAPWLALGCLVGLLLAYGVLANFTGELRAALWGEPGRVSAADCRLYDNTAFNAGASTGCRGTFTPDDGGSPFVVPVEGEVGEDGIPARLIDGRSGTAYVAPTVWAGVLPLGFALVLAGLPAAVTVVWVRHVRNAPKPHRPEPGTGGLGS
ncbi:hypothetical protein [Streptomyces sp. NPDC097619]|uniref:hypothetical protein n=1 Tax=Streptomyces sp. NPDC097619 TaxID=3157228 RepID=UPI003331385D